MLTTTMNKSRVEGKTAPKARWYKKVEREIKVHTTEEYHTRNGKDMNPKRQKVLCYS